MAVNQYDKDKIRAELNARNKRAREKFKRDMELLFGPDLYKAK